MSIVKWIMGFITTISDWVTVDELDVEGVEGVDKVGALPCTNWLQFFGTVVLEVTDVAVAMSVYERKQRWMIWSL